MENVEGYTVVYRQTEDVILAEVPALPGCFSDGRTLEEARERVRDAILDFLDELKESGEDVPHDVLYVERIFLSAAWSPVLPSVMAPPCRCSYAQQLTISILGGLGGEVKLDC